MDLCRSVVTTHLVTVDYTDICRYLQYVYIFFIFKHVARITISCTCWCSFHVWLHESLVLLCNKIQKGIALNCFSSFNLIGANCIRSNRLVLSSIFTKVSKPLTYHFFKQLFQTAWFRSFNFPSRKISRQRGTMARHIRGDPVIQFCTEAKLLEGLAFAS